MSDFTVVDPKGWTHDLHSIYSAYIGYFQLHAVPWYERSWGHLFRTFAAFLAFEWPAITVTDAWTRRPHIVTRASSVGAFVRMVKTRFGETLPQPPNILLITPFETSPRPLRTLNDYPSYKRLHATLPATALSALKVRVRAGDPSAVRALWGEPFSPPGSSYGSGGEDMGMGGGGADAGWGMGEGSREGAGGRDRTFLAIDFEWSERNVKSVLEWGYAAVRCGHLDALGHWPPIPDTNYRKGHYIVAEHVDKVVNRKSTPSMPWHYAFGDSQVIPKNKLPDVIEAVISSLASPDSETTPNTLVLVAHGVSGDLARLEEMGIKLPHNVLILDTAAYERALYSSGFRGILPDPKTPSKPRAHGTTLSLENLLRSLTMSVPEGTSGGGAGGGGNSPVTPTFGPQLSASLGPTASTSYGTAISPFQYHQQHQQRSGSSSPISPSFPHHPTPPPPSQTQTQMHANTNTQVPMPLPNIALHNAGNDAFMCLFALQALLEPTTRPLNVRKARGLGGPLADPRQIGVGAGAGAMMPGLGGGGGGGGVYPGAYPGVGGSGYFSPGQGQGMYTGGMGAGGYASSPTPPTLVIPGGRTVNTPPRHSPVPGGHPSTPGLAYPVSVSVSVPMNLSIPHLNSSPNGAGAGVGRAQHQHQQQQHPTSTSISAPVPASMSESESCPSSPSAETSSAASVAYDLAEELGRMQVERTSSRSPGPGVYPQLQLQLAGVDGRGGLGVGAEGDMGVGAGAGAGVVRAQMQTQSPSPSPKRNVWTGRGGASWKK